jgi:hypothetical protein
VRRKAHEAEHPDGREGKSESHEVGVLVPCGVHPEVPRLDVVRAATPAPGGSVRRLAQQKESLIEEGYLMSDHVHTMIAIPLK